MIEIPPQFDNFFPEIQSSLQRLVDAINFGDRATASQELKAVIERGHASVFDDLLIAYQVGEGVSPHSVEASKLAEFAAEHGFLNGYVSLGILRAGGTLGPPNDTEAMKWYRVAAEQGHVVAQFKVGYFFEHGMGVNQDYRQARRWYRLAARGPDSFEHPFAQSRLGGLFAKGHGVKKDCAVALRWFRCGAKTSERFLGLPDQNAERSFDDHLVDSDHHLSSALRILTKMKIGYAEAAKELGNVAGLRKAQRLYAEIEQYFHDRAMKAAQLFGDDNITLVEFLNDLAAVYEAQKRFDDAEKHYQRSLRIVEQACGSEDIRTSSSLLGMARLREANGACEDAIRLYERALAIRERCTTLVLRHYGLELRRMGDVLD